MKQRQSPRTFGPVAAAFVMLALLLAAAGCASGQSAIGRVISALGGDEKPLPAEARSQLGRFETVYKAYSADPTDGDRLKYFEFAFRRVRSGYVQEVSDATLIDAAIKGVRETKSQPGSLPPKQVVESALETMLSSLDPHSRYLNAEELRESFVQTSGEFGGLGIEITMEDGLVKVLYPIDDTPAERAGLKSGDLITHVDGDPVKGKTLIQAVKRMRGQPGTAIVLTVRRDGQPDFQVAITRAIVIIRAVRWRIENDVGYIRVARFTEKVEAGVEQALDAIHAALGKRLVGVVLDMRNNPGGLLEQSLALADAFLDSGEIVSIRGRNHRDDRSHRAEPGDLAKGAPMAVLINGGSASASEIVASALQFHRRATLIGSRSFGKGSVQSILPLPVEGGLRLTTSIYYAPSGHSIQARGVEPDIVLTPANVQDKNTEKDKDQDKDKIKVRENGPRREADLPGALPPVGKEEENGPHPRVPEEACPSAGEKEDRHLGCALAFLRAGSLKNFLAMTSQRPRI